MSFAYIVYARTKILKMHFYCMQVFFYLLQETNFLFALYIIGRYTMIHDDTQNKRITTLFLKFYNYVLFCFVLFFESELHVAIVLLLHNDV